MSTHLPPHPQPQPRPLRAGGDEEIPTPVSSALLRGMDQEVRAQQELNLILKGDKTALKNVYLVMQYKGGLR